MTHMAEVAWQKTAKLVALAANFGIFDVVKS
jgi:hypothetical protein